MDRVNEWRKLMEPGSIGKLQLKNRIVLAPMGTFGATTEGEVTDELLEYYEIRARGGTGLIIVEASCVDFPVGRSTKHGLAIDDDRYMPGLTSLASIIKEHGARAAIQLHHTGIDAQRSITGHQPVGPSAISMSSKNYEVAHGLSIEEISELIGRYADAAVRAQEAGFDGVEVHAAHSYLIAQFLSPAWNKRDDEYGGELTNRARFLVEIIGEIKRRTGSDFPVWCRINGVENGLDGGLTLDDACQVARIVQDAGGDAVHVSSFGWGKYALSNLPDTAGPMLPLARKIKGTVNIPVIAVGRITPELGEKALTDGWTDFVAIGRAMLADPDIPLKLMQGRALDIVPCIACNYCLHSVSFEEKQVECSVNPALGRERISQITKTENPRNILIVGSGPAGMESARVAALRGHKVILCERESRLGGQLNLAIIPPTKRERIKPLLDYMVNQIQNSGIEVRLDYEVTPAAVKKLKPDVVILATGINKRVPEIKGIDRPNVVSFEDVLLEKIDTGGNVAVIGGELVGCETAEFLADHGKKVTVMRRGKRIATGIPRASRPALLNRMRDKNIEMLTEIEYKEINDSGVVITDNEGKHRVIPVDTVVLAAGAVPDTRLYQALNKENRELHLIGDAREPRGIRQSIAEGFNLGLTL